MVTPAAQREAVAHLRTVHGMSERRACTVIAADRKTIRYRSRRPDDAALRVRIRELAAERRRFGYRRLHVLLPRRTVTVRNAGPGSNAAPGGTGHQLQENPAPLP
jgi:putative transposase